MNESLERSKGKPYHHGDLRNALLQAALELLTEGGAAALDLRKVARKAGVSHAAPYRHFADKQALIAALSEEGFKRLAERIQSALQEAPDSSYAQLLSIARAYVGFAVDNPWLMREMFSGGVINREAYPDLYRASKAVFKFYVEAVRQGQARGEIVEGDPGELAGVLWSMLHGVSILVIEDQMHPYADGPEGLESVTRSCIERLYTGLGRS
ncbi:TetR/AcrR family transcriptional regulator [Ktedonosporobacter rubrisoli]|uniref:TetR/AcrR family transcriptional regulator n=1 Tax=Ktedonosporobacter rubrisoli TaxID=2509675 RepID=A0A4V0YY98_KTERU|nr:TetR/AcrR family transcriptional regulator [Ktedonosporobacter rubrisoli]QBD75471.1 TetR/AcrR family transcriptional regulator [Ktedonosporobacter rubrisoli]